MGLELNLELSENFGSQDHFHPLAYVTMIPCELRHQLTCQLAHQRGCDRFRGNRSDFPQVTEGPLAPAEGLPLPTWTKIPQINGQTQEHGPVQSFSQLTHHTAAQVQSTLTEPCDCRTFLCRGESSLEFPKHFLHLLSHLNLKINQAGAGGRSSAGGELASMHKTLGLTPTSK